METSPRETEVEIVGLPAKVKAVEVKVLELIVTTLVKALAESMIWVPSIWKAVVALRVVNLPVVAEVEPIVPGETQVAPSNKLASTTPLPV